MAWDAALRLPDAALLANVNVTSGLLSFNLRT